MKKLNYLLGLLVLVAFGLTFTACSDDDDDDGVIGPSVELLNETGYISANYTATPNETLMFKVDVRKGDANLETLVMKRDDVQIGDTYELEKDADVVEITTDAPAGENDYAYKFEATDKDGETGSVTITVTVETAATYTEYTGVQVYSGTDDSADRNNIWASSDNSVFSYANANSSADMQAKADLVYYYDGFPDGGDWTFASPDGVTPADFDDADGWASKNSTRFATLTTTAFDDADFAAVGTPTDVKVTMVAIGDVYGLLLDGGKRVILKVTAIEGTYEDGDYITFDARVEL